VRLRKRSDTKVWNSSVEGHLLWNRPTVGLYLFRGIGAFVIVAAMFPRARFLGAAIMGVGFVAVDFISYQIAWALYCRKLRRKYPNRPD